MTEEVCERSNCCHQIGAEEVETVWIIPGKRFGSRPRNCPANSRQPCRFYPVFTPENWDSLNKDVPFPTS
ncbi:hypothetical protein [Minisyncoccus archaeiphilus]|uniref:hypothetical protein n=1 Tax=Minisyncoccus archaeiphilus TaxID=3238481 RepID=UPI00399C6E24